LLVLLLPIFTGSQPHIQSTQILQSSFSLTEFCKFSSSLQVSDGGSFVTDKSC
jgi:hypothetical protein